MPSPTLQSNTLGEKHAHFNKLVQEAHDDKKQFTLTKINSDESDIENLLKIEIAYKTNDVDYMVEVFKCNDMLYVSRAIKRCTWFITEQKYAHVFNPQYLYTQVFPYMLTKAINKLLLHIRLHLRDERRVEEFYLYLKEVSNDAQKWLLNCSIPFIENAIEKEHEITLKLFRRLCKRSVKFLRFYSKIEGRYQLCSLKVVSFLLKTNTEEFLKILDGAETHSRFPLNGKKHTEIVMKKCSKEILANFEKYADSVHLPTVIKYLKKEEIKDFMLKNSKKLQIFFSNHSNLQHFIKGIPEEDRFEFVKQVYINKNESASTPSGLETLSAAKSTCLPDCSIHTYQWYEYAPFDVALTELKKLIRAESSPAERCAILLVLIKVAKDNLQDTKTLLQYYFSKHRNEPFKFRNRFVDEVITQMATHKFDRDTWNALDQLFYSLEVYMESINDINVQCCLRAIVMYKVLHDEKIPEIVEKKLYFHTFKMFQLNAEEGKKIFDYLLSSIMAKLQNQVIINEGDLRNTFYLLINAFDLLRDWKKNLKMYPLILTKISEMLKIRKENSWGLDVSYLYDMKKSWQKYMFKESLLLKPSAKVCFNALKHEPQLLEWHKDVVNTVKVDDAVSMRQLLRKLRIYWPQSLAQQWTDEYLNNINNSTGHEALIRNLFVLLPQRQVIDMAKKYEPTNSKIVWSEIDPLEFRIIENIAKYLHTARPSIPLDVVLMYAKGDYLQYAVPSLNAILFNISKDQSRDSLSKLLDSPVSLQKFGIRLAFTKLKFEELIPIILELWKSTNNLTIRALIFTYTFKLMCKVEEPSQIRESWNVLSTFIDNLTADDNKTIFNILGKVKEVNICIQGEFYMKSYTFLESLPAAANCETHKNKLFQYAPNIIDLLEADYIADKMLAPVEDKLSQTNCKFIDLMSSFVLYGKTEDEQCERFRRILVPALEYAVNSWNVVKDGEYVVKGNVDDLLRALIYNMKKFLIAKKIIVPVKLFSEINMFMEQNMPMEENYVRNTSWKLITEYVKLVAEHKDIIYDSKLNDISLNDFKRYWLPENAEAIWVALHIKLSPQMGQIIVKHLKEDIEKYFPTIWWFFSNALNFFLSNLSFHTSLMEMETLKYVVLGEDFIPSYIVVCEVMPKYIDDTYVRKRREIRDILSAHPSIEVKMHYQRAFAELPDIV